MVLRPGSLLSTLLCSLLSTLLTTTSSLSNTWSLSNMMLATSGTDQANLALTGSVAAAATLAMEECGQQFNTEVWNCPAAAFRARREERQNNRETAYMTSITAAAVTHTVTRNCSQGGIQHCECEPRSLRRRATPWQWGGCSANVLYGEQVWKIYKIIFKI